MIDTHESQETLKGLAKAFDQICTLADPLHRDHIVAWHMERPEAFRWFVKGAMWQRDSQQGTTPR